MNVPLSNSHDAAVLMRLARALTESIEIRRLLELAVHEVAAFTGADRASIWLIDESRDTLISAAIAGVGVEFAEQWRGERRYWRDEPLSREALDSGGLVIVEDPANDSRTDKGAVHLFGDKTILVAPLVAGGFTVGTLYLNHVRHAHTYEQGNLELIEAIGALVAQAIRNAELYEISQNRQLQLRRSFQQIGNALASTVHFDETLEVIMSTVHEFLHATSSAIGIFGPPDTPVTIHAIQGELEGRIHEVLPAIERTDNVRVLYVPGDPPLGCLAAPMQGRSGPIGTLIIARRSTSPFDEEEFATLQTFASQAAIAIEDARLYQLALARERNAQKRAETLNRLNEIGTVLNQSLDLPMVMRVIADSAKDLVDSDEANIVLLDETGAMTSLGEDEPLVPLREEGLTNAVRRTGNIVFVNETSTDPRVNPRVVQQGVRSTLVIPLKVEDLVRGVLYLNWYSPHSGSEDMLAICEILATHASVALRNARLFNTVVEEKEKLSSIVENSYDGIILLDSDQRVLMANPAVYRLVGASEGEILNNYCFDAVGCGGSFETHCDVCPFSLDPGEGDVHDIEVLNREGKRIGLNVSFGRVEPNQGDFDFGIAILRDMTEERRLASAKEQFVAMISHELRTPLALLKGYLSTIRGADQYNLFAERRNEFFAGAERAVDRLRRLVDDLLMSSKLEAGVLSLNRELVDLGALVEQERSWFSTLGVARLVRVHIPSEPAYVLGDRQRLEEILHNLAENANKYSPTGDPIDLEVRPGKIRNVPAWYIVVRDQGRGLTDEEADRIFERFYRGEDARAGAVAGMGLGLSIVKGLVEAHDGQVWVEPGTDRGTVFIVALPAAQGRIEK